MDLQAVRLGLAVNAATCVTPVRAFAYPRETIDPPTFVVSEIDVSFHQSMGNLNAFDVTCVVFVSNATDRGGVAKVDAFLSYDNGIPEALESDRTLSGACSDLIVTGARGPRVYQVGGTDFYAAEFTVKVWG